MRSRLEVYKDLAEAIKKDIEVGDALFRLLALPKVAVSTKTWAEREEEILTLKLGTVKSLLKLVRLTEELGEIGAFESTIIEPPAEDEPDPMPLELLSESPEG